MKEEVQQGSTSVSTVRTVRTVRYSFGVDRRPRPTVEVLRRLPDNGVVPAANVGRDVMSEADRVGFLSGRRAEGRPDDERSVPPAGHDVDLIEASVEPKDTRGSSAATAFRRKLDASANARRSTSQPGSRRKCEIRWRSIHRQDRDHRRVAPAPGRCARTSRGSRRAASRGSAAPQRRQQGRAGRSATASGAPPPSCLLARST
jgi:hypothetical protein